MFFLSDKAFNGLFLKVPTISNVFANFGTMCLPDPAICGGLDYRSKIPSCLAL